MNATIMSSRLKEQIPHWFELEKLSKDDKITLVAVLSSSILESEERKPKDRTQEMIDCCCGLWVGEQTAEEIISNINDSKMSKSNPVKFD